MSISHEQFDKEVLKTIDDTKVTQLTFFCVDKSGSMMAKFDNGLDRFQASQKFITNFTDACYKNHVTSLYGAIMFNSQIEIRSNLTPLANTFNEKLIVEGERPSGGAALFRALKNAAELLVEANKGPGGKPKYPNAVLRIIVLSDGNDIYENPASYAQISNFLLQNKVRVDSFVVSSFLDVSPELMTLSRASGGVTMLLKSLKEGLKLFSQEEFINVELRKFGPMHPANLTASDFEHLKIKPEDIDSHIPVLPIEFANNDKKVTSSQHLISIYDKQKRIIDELRDVIDDPRLPAEGKS